MQAIIPVAGLGTRMLPISQAVPKELLPLGKKPALQWVAEELAAAGVDRIGLVTSEYKRDIGRIFATDSAIAESVAHRPELRSLLWSSGPWQRVSFQTLIQSPQLGLGHAVLCGRAALQHGPFVVALGDCVLGMAGETATVQHMIRLFDAESADAVIAFQIVPPSLVSRYGIARPGNELECDADRRAFHVDGLVEKPAVESAPSLYAVAGRYLFSHRIFGFLERVAPDSRGEIQLTSAIENLIRDGGKVLGITLASGEERFDLGNYRSWSRAFVRFAGLEDPDLCDATRFMDSET